MGAGTPSSEMRRRGAGRQTCSAPWQCGELYSGSVPPPPPLSTRRCLPSSPSLEPCHWQQGKSFSLAHEHATWMLADVCVIADGSRGDEVSRQHWREALKERQQARLCDSGPCAFCGGADCLLSIAVPYHVFVSARQRVFLSLYMWENVY